MRPGGKSPRGAVLYHREQRLSRRRLSGAVADETYRRILNRADEFFNSVFDEQRKNMQCGRGCSLCCYGLFEIGSADVPVIAEGLEKLHPMRRKKIVRRAVKIVAESRHPNLRECSPIEKEQFFNRTASVPCPNLSESGECMIYESRPLVCRTFGLPLREGDRYIGDVCELNFTDTTSDKKMDAAWDLRWEDELGAEDEYTVPEAIVIVARLRGWL
jgi:Fe-S-cluster containining protein